MSRYTKTACTLAALIGLAVVQAPTPASAGGGITMMITPEGEMADVIRHGLAIYSIVEQSKNHGKKKNHAAVNQKGRNNAAALSQKGAGNHGLVYQRGKNHTATVAQHGYNNALGVFQFGKNGNLDFGQTGNGNVGLVFQGFW
jgi:hypothetical protein